MGAFEQISPEAKVAATKVPVLLIHGQRDSNIPVRHSRRIAAKHPSVNLWEVANANHCGAISTSPREFEQRLIHWFEDHSDAGSKQNLPSEAADLKMSGKHVAWNVKPARSLHEPVEQDPIPDTSRITCTRGLESHEPSIA